MDFKSAALDIRPNNELNEQSMEEMILSYTYIASMEQKSNYPPRPNIYQSVKDYDQTRKYLAGYTMD